MSAHRILTGARVTSALALAALAVLPPAACATSADSVRLAHFVSARIEPVHPCTTDPVTLVVTDSCSTCLQVTGISATGPNAARVTFHLAPAAVCGSGACTPQEIRLPLGVRPAGPGREFVTCVVQATADSPAPGREFSFRLEVGYDVADSCAAVPPGRARSPS